MARTGSEGPVTAAEHDRDVAAVSVRGEHVRSAVAIEVGHRDTEQVPTDVDGALGAEGPVAASEADRQPAATPDEHGVDPAVDVEVAHGDTGRAVTGEPPGRREMPTARAEQNGDAQPPGPCGHDVDKTVGVDIRGLDRFG